MFYFSYRIISVSRVWKFNLGWLKFFLKLIFFQFYLSIFDWLGIMIHIWFMIYFLQGYYDPITWVIG